jgi:hypothetical protein
MEKIIIDIVADDIHQTQQASTARFIVEEKPAADGKRLASTVITAMFLKNDAVAGIKPGVKYKITIEEVK